MPAARDTAPRGLALPTFQEGHQASATIVTPLPVPGMQATDFVAKPGPKPTPKSGIVGPGAVPLVEADLTGSHVATPGPKPKPKY